MIFGKHVNRYYLKYSPLILLGLIALFLVDSLHLVIPKLYGMVINGIDNGVVVVDGVERAFDMNFLLDEICLPMIIIILIMVLCRFLWRICLFGAGILMETNLRGRMFDHAKDLSQQYYQTNKVGNLMSYFTNDLQTIHNCFANGLLMFFDALIMCTMAISKMIFMHPILALLSLIPIIIFFCCSLIVKKYMSIKWRHRQEAFSNLSDHAQETFAGIAVIKAFVKEGYELLRFKKLCKDNEDKNVEYVKLSQMLSVMLLLFTESITCIIIGYGGYLVHENVLNAGQLVEFIGYFTSIIWPVTAIGELINLNSQGKASLERIGEFLDTPSDVADVNVIDGVEIKGEIEFKGLTFSHPNTDKAILKNISFKINAGERVGLIGRTGAGKTTIVDLILRTYNVPDGTVFIDGTDINRIPIKTLRAGAAYVPQDNFLFSDTIENNISFATDNGTFEQVVQAAKMADVHSNIDEFPKKYQSVLGERGVTVSGGQKQRISIARALMKNAPILILDDSVSAVDVNTEKTILSNLKQMREGKTTILIAHRISTIENMDKIIFIDDGEIIAVGTHNELYKSCEDYKTLVDLQRLDDVKNDASDESEVLLNV
jgi:ATP-binding cassette subfamily B protein